MATLKLGVNMKYGRFFVNLSSSTGEILSQAEFNSLNEILADVEKKYKNNEIAEGDSVIFKGVAYSDLPSLKEAMRKAKY